MSSVWSVSEGDLRAAAFEALKDVGDAVLGQWEEFSGYAYHVRRRLTAIEKAHIGEAVDVRGTPEAERRRRDVLPLLPPQMRDFKE